MRNDIEEDVEMKSERIEREAHNLRVMGKEKSKPDKTMTPLEQYRAKKLEEFDEKCRTETTQGGWLIPYEGIIESYARAFLSQTIDELEAMHDKEMAEMFRDTLQ